MSEIVPPCPRAVKLRQAPRTTRHCSERPSFLRSQRQHDPVRGNRPGNHLDTRRLAWVPRATLHSTARAAAAGSGPRTDLAVSVLISDLATAMPSDCLLPIEMLLSAGRSFATFCIQSRGHFDPAEHLEVHLVEAWDKSLKVPCGERAVLVAAVGWLAVAFLRGDHGRSQVVPIPKAV